MSSITKLTLAVLLTVGVSPAFAEGPYTPTVAGDTYDNTPDTTPTPNETGNTEIYRAINALLGTSFAHNRDVDSMQYQGNDNTWTDLGISGNLARIIGISVSGTNDNTIRVYNTSSPSFISPFGGGFTGFGLLGDGTSSNPFPYANSPFTSGTNFAFNLLTDNGTTSQAWDSNPANNPDGLDHMMTYQLTALQNKSLYLESAGGGSPELYTFQNPYLIAFEDLGLNAGKLGDEDYNDLVLLVDRAAPVAVPEPISTTLFLVGGAAMAGGILKRRRQQLAI